MTNTNELRKTISQAGVSIVFLAKKAGITRESFYQKMKNETEFKASEIVALADALHLTNEKRDSIFFAPEVEF